jgi:hypothetical protein
MCVNSLLSCTKSTCDVCKKQTFKPVKMFFRLTSQLTLIQYIVHDFQKYCFSFPLNWPEAEHFPVLLLLPLINLLFPTSPSSFYFSSCRFKDLHTTMQTSATSLSLIQYLWYFHLFLSNYCGSVVVEALCYKPESRGIVSQWDGFFQIYLILLAALWPWCWLSL